jgi:hypothetical protein
VGNRASSCLPTGLGPQLSCQDAKLSLKSRLESGSMQHLAAQGTGVCVWVGGWNEDSRKGNFPRCVPPVMLPWASWAKA